MAIQIRGKPHEQHNGLEPITVGPYTLYASGIQYKGLFERIVSSDDLVLVPLTRELSEDEFNGHDVIPLHLVDFGGVPSDWEERLKEQIIPQLKAGRTLLAFCVDSHGRTGTFLASLIALLETEEETPDPIAAVRQRHCFHAVETLEQAEGILALPRPTIRKEIA